MSLTPERWARIEPHLDALLELPVSGRTAYLDGLPAGDRELRTDLERLLAASEGETLSSLATRAPELLGAAVGEGADPALGRTLGAYRLVERIGSGGMGVVYRAERADEAYRQEVAVKVLPWHAGREAARRFRMERETLARLDHENVTRILDGGVTPDGLSYLVMELVRGVPITDFVRTHGWRVRERVRLLLDVCEAVHAAHQRLIVHRDLKPGNVMVTDDAQVKVLDFGIAKWLDEEAIPGAANLTRTSDRVLTPQYASPEQFRGEELTTASDVYSLGVLLYELIADAPPYVLEGKSPTEQDRLVCETMPSSPAGGTSGADRRMVTGDLERVVLKALRKEPGRRYHSAEALAEDLRAWLEGRPVSATPDSRRYRFRRFVARNRVGATAGAAVVLALLAGLVGTAWQAGVASSERDRARAEARHAREVSDFLVEAIEQANPWASTGEEVTVSHLLDGAAARVETELADQPDVQIALYNTMGKVYSHLHDGGKAIPLLRRGLVIADSLHGWESVESCRLRYQLSRAIRGTQPDSALALLRVTEPVLRDAEDPEARLLLASVYEDLASWTSVEDVEAGLAYSRKSVEICEDVLEEPHENLAGAYHSYASQLSGAGSPEAGVWFARAATMWRATVGEPHLNLSSTLNNWAIWCSRNNRPDTAAVLYREALDMSERILGMDSPSVMTTRINLAGFLLEEERYAESEELLRSALDVLTVDEPAGLRTAAAWANLGHSRFHQEDYAGAAEHYREGRRVFAGTYGESHLYVAAMDLYLARVDWMEERIRAAALRFDEAFAILGAVHPTGIRREAVARVWSGRLHLEAGNLERAERDLRTAVEYCDEVFPEGDWRPAEARTALGAVLVATGRLDEGEPLLREGHRALDAARGADDPLTRWAAGELARLGGGT